MAGQSTITNIYSKSFPGVNLFEASLIRDDDPQLPFYKTKFFMFLSIMPGQKTESGGRTYVKDNKITLKVDCDKVLALSHSIRAYAHGDKETGKYLIFTSGKNETKRCEAGTFQPAPKPGEPQKPEMISIGITKNKEKPIGIYVGKPEAMAIADILEKIALYAIDLDMQFRSANPGGTHVPQAPPMANQYQNNSAPGSPPMGNDSPDGYDPDEVPF